MNLSFTQTANFALVGCFFFTFTFKSYSNLLSRVKVSELIQDSVTLLCQESFKILEVCFGSLSQMLWCTWWLSLV